jgi:coatomer subunit delta
MVAISLAIVSKTTERILLSRLFVPMAKVRLDLLISQFFKLLNTADQNTLVQGPIVNYLFKPLDPTTHLILILTKDTNIICASQSLNLACQVLSDICHPVTQEAIQENCFELLFAIDELFPILLIDDTPSALQVSAYLAMDSANEKIEEMITKDKEKEAKQKAKEKMKQLDLQRKENAAAAARKSSSSKVHLQQQLAFDSGSVSTAFIEEAAQPVARSVKHQN